MDKRELMKQRELLVVKDNELIQKARYNLTSIQQKLVAYLISKIRPTDEDFKEYEIRVEDFCEVTGIDKTYFYTEFREMIDDLDKNKSVWIKTDKEIYKFRWFDDTTYLVGKGTIRITLTRRLKNYLIGLSQNFTQYELYNILALKSKYAIRMFELFKSYAYQRSKEFDIDELKELLMAENYVNFKDFRRRILEPAIAEINEYTDLDITYDTTLKGRKVVNVKFLIRKKGYPGNYESFRKTINRLDQQNGQMQG